MVLATENVLAMTTPQKKNPHGTQANPAISSPILQADELSMDPRWSPHLKSPRPSSTISSRLRQRALEFAADDDSDEEQAVAPQLPLSSDGAGPAMPVPGDERGAARLTSPLNKRARILQTGSPESLPPLSPVVSNRRRSLRAELTQDTPFPFSPNQSGLRIRYSPSSPMSPTLRATPNRSEPESPTLSRILAKDSPSLSLEERLGSLDDESPTMSQMSRSLLFRLDIESPTARRNSVGGSSSAAASDGAKPADHSPLLGSKKDKLMSGPPSDQLHHSPLPMLCSDDAAFAGDGKSAMATKQPTAAATMRRPSNASRGSTKAEQRRRNAGTAPVPQLFVSPQHPRTDPQFEWELRQQVEQVRKHFECSFGAREVDFCKVTQACGLPRFANRALFRYVNRNSSESAGRGVIGKRPRHADREAWPSYGGFCRVWMRLRRASSDMHALLFNVLADDPTRPRARLTRSDIRVLVTDVVDHHYELEFLEGQGQFLQSYTQTVVERIFYVANRTWDGQLTLAQFRKADVVGMLRSIEAAIDVEVDNPGVFSYKHFYVLFCSFFELDANHDSLLDARDLLRYFSGSLSRRIISRIMMGKGKPSGYTSKQPVVDEAKEQARAEKRKGRSRGIGRYDLKVRLTSCRMTYNDFIWFLLSEIDKTSPAAIEYWFRCLDLDDDGVLSMYELEYFYDEQIKRMEDDMTSDIIMMNDLMCQLSDLVRPEREGLITLKDLRRAPPALVPVFFDAFMNLARFIEHESRTSFLQRQLAQLSMRALPKTSFADVIQMRINFLASIPSPWVEFADLEYAALLQDHETQDEGDQPKPDDGNPQPDGANTQPDDGANPQPDAVAVGTPAAT
ncbi:Serine/threonine-protein phosphatase 2A regulatory subunit B'' subunit alpha [Coemansia sp. RSA 552]|nr:Serine/threonine-protein phosphatase 2A regulatory subunit B'' subunit alpha [Coemansia sp. RSA 552]